MRIAATLMALAWLVGAGCSGGSGLTQLPAVGEACSEVGALTCSEDDAGRPVVLMCTLGETGEMTWTTAKVCELGCADGHCTKPDVIGEVPLGDAGETSELPAEVTPPDTGEVHVKDNRGAEDGGGPEVCMPECAGKVCGEDGCGGKCGECGDGQKCVAGGSECCVVDCFGKLCGDDGCGGTCGICPEGQECSPVFHQCQPKCQPKCEGKECGPDGCDGTCGECPAGKGCGPEGTCSICVPLCEGKECGPDGCGKQCGACKYMYQCNVETAKCEKVCIPVCAGKECGDNGCGGSCGECLPGESCVSNQCEVVCVPVCGGKECGPDGCGGSCGKCPKWAACSAQGMCISDCAGPSCEGKVCGSDGCGGSCGTCAPGLVCSPAGLCVQGGGECGAVGKEGWCDGNKLLACLDGVLTVIDCLSMGKNVVCEFLDATQAYGCNPHGECVPGCIGKECGDDGCGGKCGECPVGKTCTEGQCKGQGPCGDVGYAGCCSGNTALWCDGGMLWFMDCSVMADPAHQKCGWNEELKFYDCVAEAVEGPDSFPYFCEGPCVPNCAGKQCGDDGCGKSCGECPQGLECVGSQCEGPGGGCGGYGEEPACQGEVVIWCEGGKIGFSDCTKLGKYWHCGWVPDLFVNGCYEEKCIPDCENKQCGDDGCGYVCGYCAVTQMCNDKFQCVYGQGLCGEVDYVGLCEGNIVKWCQNGVLQIFDCMNLGPTWKCGWYVDGGYYWCIQ